MGCVLILILLPYGYNTVYNTLLGLTNQNTRTLVSWVFVPCAGKGGAEGDGDIYNPENLVEFQHFVLANTNQQDPGVHFVMADGVSVHMCTWCTVVCVYNIYIFICLAYIQGWPKNGLFLTVCNSRICWQNSVLYIKLFSFFIQSKTGVQGMICMSLYLNILCAILV